jgi:hypothetical protein
MKREKCRACNLRTGFWHRGQITKPFLQEGAPSWSQDTHDDVASPNDTKTVDLLIGAVALACPRIGLDAEAALDERMKSESSVFEKCTKCTNCFWSGDKRSELHLGKELPKEGKGRIHMPVFRVLHLMQFAGHNP